MGLLWDIFFWGLLLWSLFLCSLLLHFIIYLCACVYRCTCVVCVHPYVWEARGQPQLSFLRNHPPCVLRQGLPLAQGLPVDVSLAGQRALGILLSQLFQFSF